MPFRVVNSSGGTAFTGHVGSTRGAWNDEFGAVEPLNFTALDTLGTYRVVVDAAGGAASPWFSLASSATLFGPRVADTLHFFRAQRDGADVISGAWTVSRLTSTMPLPRSTPGQPTRTRTAT